MKSIFKKDVLISLLSVIFMLLLWVASYFIVSNDYILPSPFTVIKNAFLLFFKTDFYGNLSSTLLRALVATTISIIIGVFLGVLANIYDKVNAFLLPITAFMRSLPTLALILIILVAFPRNITPIIICIITLIPNAYSFTLNSLSSVDINLKEMLKVYNVPVKKQITVVYIKGIFPSLIKEFFTSLSFALKLVVSAEILANVYGSIGGTLQQASLLSNVETLFSITLTISILGVLFELLGKFIYSKSVGKYL